MKKTRLEDKNQSHSPVRNLEIAPMNNRRAVSLDCKEVGVCPRCVVYNN